MTQSEALQILKTGGNVFLTGEPGAGKTYILNEYIAWLEASKVSVAVTASTGIAATHIGGMTIHSWSGIGARDTLTPYDLDAIMGREKVVKRIKKAKVLVIDEISMLDGRVLDMVETVCRTARGNGEPFGGLQIVLVGDFFQLPPIAGKGEMSRFAFESRAWESSKFLTCYLTEQFRQEDEMLLGLLSSIRSNSVDEEHYTLLGEQKEIGFPDIEPTKLYTHNRDVDSVNSEKLLELSTESRVYEMASRGAKALVEGLVRNCLSPETLQLKREAMVMCTKNNFEVGYVNGTLGRVLDFDHEDGYPIIVSADGREMKITPHTWSVEEDGKVLAEITQVPLRLAWAITVHKSQGMSLDAAEIDLRNAFTYGQGYVALSRVRSLIGMKLLGLNSQALTVDPRIVLRDERFREESDEAQYAFDEMDDDEITKMHKNFVESMDGTWFEGAIIKKEPGERIRKESTLSVTCSLLEKGMNVREIAKERGLAQSTIWGHVEKLATQGDLTSEMMRTLTPTNIDWTGSYKEMERSFDKYGTEKLKPVFEDLEEKYDYDAIRLGRIMYTASS